MNFEHYELVDFTIDYSYDIAFCPVCNAEADIQSSQKQMLKNGLSFAHCGDIIYQVVQCHTHDCKGRFVYRCGANDPVFDMSGLILMPFTMLSSEYHDEAVLNSPPDNWPDNLKFKRSKDDQSYVSVMMDEVSFWNQIDEEKNTDRIHLKRLCPETEYYLSLFLLVPNLHEIGARENYEIVNEHINKIDLPQASEAIRYLMDEVSEKPLNDQIIETLQSKGFELSKDETKMRVAQKIDQELYPLINQLLDMFTQLPLCFELEANSIFQAQYQKIFYAVCSAVYLENKRKELSGWISKIQEYSALFVDAPMGLGKTYSIVEGVAKNPDLSAIIFLPTKRLCHSFCVNLADRISEINGLEPTVINGVNHDKRMVFDGRGPLYVKCTEEYLERNNVYMMEGINEAECPHYDEIIERYNKCYFTKKSKCSQCELNYTCRFLKHKGYAKGSRIVVTTHAMYDHIFNNFSEYKWDKYGNKKPVRRDLFLIDEDLIFANCYQPISLEENDFREFVATVTNFLNDTDWFSKKAINKEIFLMLDSLLAQFVKCDVTSYIPPINPNFSFPDKVKDAWQSSIVEREDIVPDTLNTSNLVGNYLEIIEKSIRQGFVAQKYKLTNGTIIKNIFLPNPKTYRFKPSTPKHVFFDGTLHDEDLLEQKLINVDFDYIKISLGEPFWDIQAYQNVNTDLPKSKVPDNENTIKKLLLEIIPEIGYQNRFFILTSKTLRKKIQHWLMKTFTETTVIVEHYGNLRGVNTAKECNIGIVLGSYILSDALEIALSLDFIVDNFKDVNPVPIATLNNFWTWQGRKGERKYKEPYRIIEKVSNQYRYAEYRQAIARTRYLFHPVSFYVFSKDRINEYEPFISRVETYQYKNSIFPEPPDIKAMKADEIERAVFDWLKDNDTVSATDIHKKHSIRRQTVAKYLKDMCDNNKLSKATNYKKRYCKNGSI